MKTAKKMFEELGYEQYEQESNIVYYKDGHNIEFHKESRYIVFDKAVDCYLPIYVSMELLQIIYKQIEELGWEKESN